jgi:hypothetical protein
MLTVSDLRSGDSAAYTLVGEGKSLGPISEAAELLNLILDELLIDSPANALDALSADTLDRIVAYLNEPAR